MRYSLFSWPKTLLLFPSLTTPVLAQVPTAPAPAADTTHKYENPANVPAPVKQPFFKSKIFKAVAVPAVLIGYGAHTFNGGCYTNQDANRDIHRLFPTYRAHLDNYPQFAPYLEIGAVALVGVPSRNDRVNVGLFILKSELIMLSSVYLAKTLSHEERPDGSDNLWFPSGHTAQAFLAASIVCPEFRDTRKKLFFKFARLKKPRPVGRGFFNLANKYAAGVALVTQLLRAW